MKRTQFIYIPILSCLLANTAFAQTSDGNSLGAEFWLGADTVYNTNFYYAESQERKASGAIIRPSFQYTGESTRTNWQFSSGAESGFFSVPRFDNYVDTKTDLQGSLYLGRSALFTTLGYITDHDAFGSNRTLGQQVNSQDLDKWQEPWALVGLRMGGDGQSLFSLEISSEYRQRDYTTNGQSTDFLNRTRTDSNLLLGISLSPKTSILINPYHQLVSFDLEPSQPGDVDRSGETLGILAGLRWAATAKTSGDIRVGVAERTPDDGSEKFDSSYWTLGLSWSPRTQTNLRLESSRTYSPSYRRNVRFIDDQSMSLFWNQQWNRRLDSQLTIASNSSDFVGSAEAIDYLIGSFRLNWRADRSFVIYSQMNYFDRDAVTAGRDAEQSQFSVGLDVKLN